MSTFFAECGLGYGTGEATGSTFYMTAVAGLATFVQDWRSVCCYMRQTKNCCLKTGHCIP